MKKKKKGETTKEWYERITGQSIGSLVNQGTSTVTNVPRS